MSCLWHSWTNWTRFVATNLGGTYQARTCLRCGKTQAEYVSAATIPPVSPYVPPQQRLPR